jgi:16S rRNA (guanine(527)-N(7))-methyltransferase RsmG
MDPSRISALLEPFLGPPGDRRLSTDDLDKISTYIDLLLRWNARINLTAIRDPEQIVPRHFGESLFMARHLFPDPGTKSEGAPTESAPRIARIASIAMSGNSAPVTDRSRLETGGPQQLRVIDLGSGAGFPALPIKIWAPHIHLTMIESNHKKAAFLREAVRTLTLTDVDVIAERAESVAARLPSTAGKAEPAKKPTFQPAEVVTFRAVEKFNKILPLASKFLAHKAQLAVLLTSAQLDDLRLLPSIKWVSIHVPQSHHRIVAIGSTEWED